MLQQRGIWEDDLTREFVMKQEEEFQKQAKETVQKQLKDGNVQLFSFLREPMPTIEEIQDWLPTLTLENDLTIENETDSEDLEDSENDTDVEEPPPCPVHLM